MSVMRLHRHISRGIGAVNGDPTIITNPETSIPLLRELIMGAVLVDAQNVYEHLLGEHPAPLRTLSGLVSPWPIAWFELVSAVGKDVGILATTDAIDDDSRGSLHARYDGRTLVHHSLDGARRELTGITIPDEGFVVTTYAFQRHGIDTLFPGWSTYFTDPDGTPQLTASGRFVGYAECDERDMEFVSTVQRIAATACAFANCKNVRTVEEEQRYASRQERRAAERRNDPPLARFYTLRIDPKIARSQSTTEPSGQHRALPLHIVRGHFATYHDYAPLFGKYSGTFWIPAHVRGSEHIGIVGKDYAVESAEAIAV